MAPDDLLPPNATALERSLSVSTDLLARLAGGAEALAGFKTAPADSLLPWLIWEYGLGELLPYLPDPRRAIAEGILWQRLRGTPAALTTALSWIGATATVEQETPGIHFAEFQFDPGQVLDDDGQIANMIAIARLSAPARSRLSRIYHGWDLRRLVLDESRLGEALLSDHSGVFWQDGLTKLSFGRIRQSENPPTDIVLTPAREAVRFAVARLIDRYLLDFSALGDPGHTRNEEILHSHLFTLANALGVPDPSGMRPERRFCRAMVVLSDSTPLGDINANLPRFVWQETGSPITLGSGDRLSATPHRLIRVEVLERFYAVHPASSEVPSLRAQPSRSSEQRSLAAVSGDGQLGQLMLGDTMPQQGPRGAMTRLSSLHNLVGQRWIDQVGWIAERWRDLLREPEAPAQTGFLPARKFCKAQIVLSEVVLGEVNSRTPRRAVYRTRSIPRLGDIVLGDQGEIEWRPLTEMHIGLNGLTGNLPYAFEEARQSLLRLLMQSVELDYSAAMHSARVSTASAAAAWSGQTWTGVRWPASRWADARELIGTDHTSQS
ncbi:phage tail protein [Thauera propionica]|uniref:phage tail protein n=1 Tax=Thauera propionica TaxID=2019431 RepID=UPI0023F2744F|nr:phage tail protein [Thauera propionica]MDD3676886.1 phage tail protein [Thauera propionica]